MVTTGARTLLFVVGKEVYFRAVFDALRERIAAERVVIPSGKLFHKSRVRIRLQILLGAFTAFRAVSREVLRRPGKVILVCQTAHYGALLARRLLPLIGKRIDVYVFNFYIHELGRHALVQTILRFLLKGRVGLLVQSPNEIDYYRRLAPGIDVAYYPYCLNNLPAGVEEERRRGETVFTGGYTNRDYDIVLEAAARTPDLRFVIACSDANKFAEPVPANVEVVRGLDAVEFHRRMAQARVVVVPLKSDVGSSGQMVALAAMKLEKPVVFTRLASVGQYFEEGVTGIGYPAGDAGALTAAIVRLHENPELAASIGQAAREVVLARFSRESYERRIVAHVTEFCGLPTTP